MRYRGFVVLILAIGTFGFSIQSCDSDVSEGEQLAKTYCASCHMYPEPSLLPKNVWELSTLPYMGIYLGLDKEIENLPKELQDYQILKPEKALISYKDYQKIKAFYLKKAPNSIDEPYEKVAELKSQFSIEKLPTSNFAKTIANFTAVRIDEKKQKIISGDQSNRFVYMHDEKGQLLSELSDQNALAYVDIKEQKPYLLTYIGYTTQANPTVNGSVNWMSFSDANEPSQTNVLLNLNRPIESLSADLDGDGEDELITNEFGFKEGGLSVWKKDAEGMYIKNVISAQTGATKTIIKDFNKDGKPDILSLCAQGDEQIVLYINKGKLSFEGRQLLRFPPIYGSSSFDIADIDNDGDFDIILTTGDNADFTTVLKPYHGVYIFKNEGDFKMNQSQFFRQNGATKVIAGDFDNDGDVDLVSIALFPDVKNRAEEGLMFFQNNKGKFTNYTLNINHLGRWAVVDAGDIDQDGDLDLILGSHPVAKFPAGFDQEWKKGTGLVLLRNNTKK